MNDEDMQLRVEIVLPAVAPGRKEEILSYPISLHLRLTTQSRTRLIKVSSSFPEFKKNSQRYFKYITLKEHNFSVCLLLMCCCRVELCVFLFTVWKCVVPPGLTPHINQPFWLKR